MKDMVFVTNVTNKRTKYKYKYRIEKYNLHFSKQRPTGFGK